jgi:flagellar biosynthesis protein FlhA
MDGASKFVKGDAVASVLVLVVNIVGGLILGTLSHGLSMSERRRSTCCWRLATRWWRRCRRFCSPSLQRRSSPGHSPEDLLGQIAGQFGFSRAWGRSP